MNNALIWFLLNILSIIVLAFYSMLEMACVSFNKVRLQYNVSQGVKQALWLNYFLKNPSRLFGTTLIGVNIALVVGSECSREFYAALGLSPDLAPLTQVFLVVILGELAPMFAARHYPEHVVMLGMPLIYASSKIMAPLLWVLGLISKLCNFLVGGDEKEVDIYLSQEELQKVLEEQSEDHLVEGDNEELSAITTNIFKLRQKNVGQIMKPLSPSTAVPATISVGQLEGFLKKLKSDYLPIYHRNITNVVGIIHPRDLLRAPNNRRIRDYARPPWFVTKTMSTMQILKQFRNNNESIAVIVNKQGEAVGTVNLDDVLEEIFGKMLYTEDPRKKNQKNLMLIEKTFSGEMTVEDFFELYNVLLDQNKNLTLSSLIMNHLGHRPDKGDSIFIPPFELTAKEMALMEVKTVSVTTRI